MNPKQAVTLVDVLDHYPLLGVSGLMPREASVEEVRAERAALEGSAELVAALGGWLGENVPPRPRSKVSSYWVKHVAEHALGDYVPNGALIAAAVIRGYRVTLTPGSPNAALGMDKRTVAALEHAKPLPLQ